MSESKCCCERFKNTPRDEETLRILKNRLNRISGQINGISRMLDDNRYCGDILTQLSAVQSALQSFGYHVLENHLKTCVSEEVTKGNDSIMDEAVDLIKKLK